MSETRYIRGQGGYRLLETVGRGGFATVWRAKAEGGPAGGKEVAVKAIPVSGSAERSRAVREGQIAEGLRHPNIVETFEVIQDGREVCLVTEFVRGEPLDEVARNYDFAEMEEALTQILEALSYAHSRGVIHRDIKPQNALVDVRGEVKLTDFGIAYRPEDTRLTQVGFAVGTPGYIAPEILDGSEPSALSDIYAVGATARALLSRHPGELPPRLKEFIDRTTSPNPTHRPQNTTAALRLLIGERQEVAERKIQPLPAKYSERILQGINGLIAGWLGFLGGSLLLNEVGAVGAAAGFSLLGYLLPRLGAIGVIVALAVALARSGAGIGVAALLPALGVLWATFGRGSLGRLPLGPLLVIPLSLIKLGAGLPLLLGVLMRPVGAGLSAAAGALVLIWYDLSHGGELRYLGIIPGVVPAEIGPAGFVGFIPSLVGNYPQLIFEVLLWAAIAAAISLSERFGRWAIGVLGVVGGGILVYAVALSQTPDALARVMTALGVAAIIYGVAKYLWPRIVR